MRWSFCGFRWGWRTGRRFSRCAPQVDELLIDNEIASQVHTELRAVAALTRRRANMRDKKGLGGLRRAITGVRWRGGFEAGWRPELVVKTPARVAVDECLAMFSYAVSPAARKNHGLAYLRPVRCHASLRWLWIAGTWRGQATQSAATAAGEPRLLQLHSASLPPH